MYCHKAKTEKTMKCYREAFKVLEARSTQIPVHSFSELLFYKYETIIQTT